MSSSLIILTHKMEKLYRTVEMSNDILLIKIIHNSESIDYM